MSYPLENMNEADIREDIASPMLRLLGYEKGTQFDILRELSLSYDRVFLGRKKSNDPPLRGRADYVLSVTGASKWTFEIKAPTVDIDQDAIDQALSYARHPEVAATYAAVFNGRRFVLADVNRTSTEPLLLDLHETNPEMLAKNLEGTLSPPALLRDFSHRTVDTDMPLAKGLRSVANIAGGQIEYQHMEWHCDLSLPKQATDPIDEMCRRMSGYVSTVTGGRVWRGEDSRIRAKLDWTAPHQEMLQQAKDKGLMDFEYVALSDRLSLDREHPTSFDVVGAVRYQPGDQAFDLVKWRSETVGFTTDLELRGQAVGYLNGNEFAGEMQAEYEISLPMAPNIVVSVYAQGSFRIEIDPR